MFKNLMGITLISMVLLTAVMHASVLEIYNDGAKYRYVPIDDYVGFANGVQATCDGQTVSLLPIKSCPEKKRLCQVASLLRELEEQRETVGQESAVLDQLVSLSKPTAIDASKWIDAAQKIGKKKAELIAKSKTIKERLQAQTDAFSRQAPSQKAVMTQRRCTGDLELVMPAGYIGARLLYEADTSDPASIAVKQYIAFSNQSGIDITAKEANVYAKSYRIYLRPQQFRPWIAQIRQERKHLKKTRAMRTLSYAEAPMMDEGGAAAPVAPVANVGDVIQMGYKNYHVSGIELPSTGEEIKVKIADYKAAVSCELVSYPYRGAQVYKACSFSPKSPIESHRWRIQKNKRLVSDQAYGVYRDGKYLLNVDVEEEVLIRRNPVVKRDKSSGIFGGSIRKKDGFELALTNLSSQTKMVKIIERIPTSTTDKIKVKLLRVEGANSHTLLPDGRLEIKVMLSPKANQRIKVLFELSYDKDTKVSY